MPDCNAPITPAGKYQIKADYVRSITPEQDRTTTREQHTTELVLKAGVLKSYVVQTHQVGAVRVLNMGFGAIHIQPDGTIKGDQGTCAWLYARGTHCDRIDEGKADTAKAPSALNTQVAGSHYKDMAIQPWELMRTVFTREEYTSYHLGTVMAYLMRHKAKGGEQDIRKAQHHLTELVEYLNAA